MGPEAQKQTISRGGPMIDSFPVDWSNHVEGHIIHHWMSNKSATCTITDPDEVPRFVSWHFYIHL